MIKKIDKGFTLVELLVTIVILGIITGISIPLIRNVRESQQRKQYETYRTSLSYASKVYVDSFKEDLFGHDEIACATVSYNQLKSKNLIKDIPISGVSCASNDTYVRIVKFEGQYSYLSKITCGSPKADGTISKDIEIPEGDINSSLCGLNVDTKIDIKFSPESSHTPNVQRKNITVEFDSPTGIHSDPIIYWAFSDKADFSSIIGEWKQLDIDVPSKKKQKAQILQGNSISLTKEFITPKNYSGKLYLVLKIDRLQDLGGKNWTKTDTEVVSGGYYAVDNEPPKLNDSEIKYSKPVHRQVTPTLNFKATDNLTSESNLRMCISEDTASDNCSKNINDIKKKQNGWVTYNKSKVLPVINNASNGENHNIFISIGDQAGNYVSQQFVYYQSPVDYSITYSLDGGSHGASHPNRVDFDEEFTVSYPSKKITTIFVNNISGCSIDYSASTVSGSGKAVNYTFNGWNITGMDTSTHTFGSRTSTNIKEDNVKETKFKGLRHTSNGVVFSATWNPPTIILPKATKTGYTCQWTSPTSYEWVSGGTYRPAEVGGATSRTFTTSCSANTFTVAYNKNGGSGSTASHTCTYDAACSAKANGFSKIGYSFTGWKKNNTGSVVAAGASIKNAVTSGTVTYWAQWKANTFKIAYNKNGGSGSMTDTSCTYDANCTLRANSFTRSGYKFAGWAESATGAVKYADSANAKNATTSGTKTLYAKWNANTFTVAYNKNGGSGSTASHTCTYDAACSAKANGFSKIGYSFTGWKKNNTGSVVAAGASIKNAATSGTVTYWAQWKANTFKIAYNKNGGSGSMTDTSCTYDANCTLRANSFTRTGYSFAGWAESATGAVKYANSANAKNATTSGTKTLYAKWKANTFKIAYNKNGGSGSMTDTSCTYDANCTLRANSFTRTGYSFAGWAESATGAVKYANSANAKNATTSGTKTLYAKWNANTFTVAYNKNGGSGTTASHTCTYNAACSAKANGFSKTGYSFTGWKKNNTGSVVAAGASIKNAATSGTVTYWAQWKANTFTVAYNANGGSGSTASHTCTYNAACNLKSSGFSKSGYKFVGWKKSNSGNTLAAGTSIKNAATSGTVTYYAQWQVNCDSSKPYWNGTNCYANLKVALDETSANGTIQLMYNTTDSSTPVSTKNGMKLVLNGHTLTKGSQPIKINGGALTITNGTITSGLDTNLKLSAGTLTVDGTSSTVIIKNTKSMSNQTSAQVVLLDKGTFYLKGANAQIISGADGRGYARGVKVNENATFNMSGGSITVTATTSYGPVGVNVHGKFNMTGGSITAKKVNDKSYGVSANKKGKVNITGGTVTITGRGSGTGLGAVVNTEDAVNSCVFIGKNAKISCTSSHYCVIGQNTTIRIQSGATIKTSNVGNAKDNTEPSSTQCS